MKWIAAGIVGIAVALTAAFAFSDNVRLAVGLILSPLFDPGPPPIFGNIKCDGGNDCVLKFDALVKHRFPLRTSAKLLQNQLMSQGFHRLSPSFKACTMEGAQSIGVAVIECPAWDSNWNPKNYLDYHWGSGPCSSTVSVRWSEDSKGRISHLEGGYDYACL